MKLKLYGSVILSVLWAFWQPANATDPYLTTVDGASGSGWHSNVAAQQLGQDFTSDRSGTVNRTSIYGYLESDPINAGLESRFQSDLTIVGGGSICALAPLMVDDFENGALPYGIDGDGIGVGFFTFNGPSAGVSISTSSISGDLALRMNSFVPPGSWGGVERHFENESADAWISQDWSTKTAIAFSIFGTGSGSTLFFEIQENRSSDSTDSTELWSYDINDDFTGWKYFEIPFADFARKSVGNGAPNDGFSGEEVHGWAFGSTAFNGTLYIDEVRVCGVAPPEPVAVQFEQSRYSVTEGETAILSVTLDREPAEPMAVAFATAESNARLDRQYSAVSGTLNFEIGETVKTIEVPTFNDGKYTRNRRVVVNLLDDNVTLGSRPRTVLTIVDTASADEQLVDDFEGFHPFVNVTGPVSLSTHTILDSDANATPYQPAYEDVLGVDFDTTVSSASFDRVFSNGQDWRLANRLSFWYFGTDTGQSVTLQIRDNMAATTGDVDPAEWVMVWSDEFSDAAGTPPNPNVWQHELGDGALNGLTGWGNDESQYYTSDVANAATDGDGNLVISLQGVDPETTDLVCWYGPCEYTSARLNTQNQLDFEYGRIEARVKVPDGPNGLWPAFWMLGSGIADVGWPQAGEIDILEYVSRVPNEIFGTIHGPGYAGGNAFGNTYNFGERVSNNYHTFTIEWSPDSIDWYVDGINYHSAVPADVSPNEWVYNQPFFLLLNAAIGGNFGGAINNSMTFPQDTLIDYVRVYQAVDTAERFQSSFVDDFDGWQKIDLPFEGFSRSPTQPTGAPDDGLTLSEVWGYGFLMPEGTTGSFLLDRVRVYQQHVDVMFKDGFD